VAPVDLPRIHLLIGPGTLTSQGRDRLDLLRYGPWHSGKERLSGEAVLAALPEVSRFARPTVDAGNPHDVATPDDLRRLALHIGSIAGRDDIDGLVLIQGTNALEETAYFLNLTVRTSKPIVVTGAQRPFTALSSDGAMNLLDAIRAAGAAEAAGKGVLVVANGEINAARDVTKTSTYRLHTFRSRDLGVLGYVDADRVIFYRSPLRRHTIDSEFDLGAIATMPQVDILYVHAGARGTLADAAVASGARGIVIAGTGGGSLGPIEDAVTAIAAAGTVVVRASRVGEGRVIRDDNWQKPGMVAADNLSAHKAALLLSLALTRTSAADEVQAIFDSY
jgi:L-asparaginase